MVDCGRGVVGATVVVVSAAELVVVLETMTVRGSLLVSADFFVAGETVVVVVIPSVTKGASLRRGKSPSIVTLSTGKTCNEALSKPFLSSATKPSVIAVAAAVVAVGASAVVVIVDTVGSFVVEVTSVVVEVISFAVVVVVGGLVDVSPTEDVVVDVCGVEVVTISSVVTLPSSW